jgi:hypothetical protein
MTKFSETAMLENELLAVVAGNDPSVIGAALGMVVATYLVGMPPNIRQDTRDMVVQLIDDLVPVVLNEMITTGRVPTDWRSSRHEP